MMEINNSMEDNNILWLKVVPLKVSSFVWQFLLNRLPTKDNLHMTGFLVIMITHAREGAI